MTLKLLKHFLLLNDVRQSQLQEMIDKTERTPEESEARLKKQIAELRFKKPLQ